jgi:glutamate synthase (NADPH/NADH) small chain
MPASEYEQQLAQTDGVRIKANAMPKRLISENGRVTGIEFEYTAEKNGKLVGTGETFALPTDQIFKAIGQTSDPRPLNGAAPGPELASGRIKVDADRRTSLPNVWAGGDCIAGGQDLTVAAAADGRIAAESIHRALTGA